MTIARRTTNARTHVDNAGAAGVTDPAELDYRPRTGPTNVEIYWWGPRRRAGLLAPLSEESRRVLSLSRHEQSSSVHRGDPAIDVRAVLAERGPMTTKQISQAIGVRYGTCVDVLTVMSEAGTIARVGRGRWSPWGLV